MTIKIKTKIDDKRVVARMSAIRVRGGNIRPWFNKLARHLAEAQLMNFMTQGSLAGGWAPLSPQYMTWKAKSNPAAPMMVRTGDLMASLTNRDRLVQSMTGTKMRIGSDVDYAHFHQRGTRNMPARKILIVPESVIKGMKRDLADYIVNGRMRS